jgi:hypothetical protein
MVLSQFFNFFVGKIFLVRNRDFLVRDKHLKKHFFLFLISFEHRTSTMGEFFLNLFSVNYVHPAFSTGVDHFLNENNFVLDKPLVEIN